MIGWRVAGFIVVVGIGIGTTGCAFTNPDHLSTTNWVDRHLSPDDDVLGYAVTPLLTPVALTTVAIDNIIITPIATLPCAWDELHSGRWKSLKPTVHVETYYSDLALLPLRVALVPVEFAFAWVCHGVMGTDPVDGESMWPTWGHARAGGGAKEAEGEAKR